MPTLSRTLTIAFALCAAAAPRLAGQNQSDPDVKEIATYRLTMETLRKYESAMRYLESEMMKDPRARAHVKLQAQVDALENKEERTEAEQAQLEQLRERLEASEEAMSMGNPQTISEMADQAVKTPPLANALRRAGLKPREYAVFTLALMQAMMYHGMKKQGFLKEPPKDMNPANAAFVARYEAELAAMTEGLKKEKKPQ